VEQSRNALIDYLPTALPRVGTFEDLLLRPSSAAKPFFGGSLKSREQENDKQ
jgi:hypothetical protein